jgi:uncharacterized damage-inducible protein DinB
MTDPAIYFRAMARNNAWANHRLLGACAKLSPEALVAPRTGFFPSLRQTLNHILVVDWFYVDAAWADDEPCQTIDALQREQAAVDRRLLVVCDRLDAAGLARSVTMNRGDRDQVERCDRLLLHLFEHQIHHRGQAHAMLSGTSVPPPQLDEFFPQADAPLRKDDLTALGWTEAEIWDGLS